MKTLVLYCSDYGFAEKWGHLIAEKKEDAVCIDFKSKEMKNLNLSLFDTIIIGASIHAGKINKKFKDYLTSNESTLLKKRIAIYICCMDKGKVEEYLATEIPKNIYNHAFFKGHMGHALSFERMNFFIRAMIKKIAHTNKNEEVIKYDTLDTLIKKIEECSA